MFGGKDAKTPVEGVGLELARDAWMFELENVSRFGEDILLEYKKAELSQ